MIDFKNKGKQKLMNYLLIKYFKFIPPELAHFFLKLIGLEIIEKSILMKT